MSEREKKFEYLEIPKPEEEPPSFRKSAAYKSVSETILDEFLKADVPRARIKVPKDRDIRGLIRGIGKIISRRKLSDKVACRIDVDDKAWLFKKE